MTETMRRLVEQMLILVADSWSRGRVEVAQEYAEALWRVVGDAEFADPDDGPEVRS